MADDTGAEATAVVAAAVEHKTEEPQASRKRPADEDEGGSADDTDVPQQQTKRPSLSVTGSDKLAVKMLIHNNLAGGIIGTRGATITELQQNTGARIKLSQNGEYFPGTQERVALVQGSLPQINAVLEYIFDKSMDDAAAAAPDATGPRQGQVKLAISSGVAGLVIGRQGENIKEAQSLTNARIQVTPKVTPTLPWHSLACTLHLHLLVVVVVCCFVLD
eukprot:m.82292 g.82292  ORF g.82292 m.82292 type:complete len:219 (-) comp14724_c0_seq3:339-995(-)